MTGRWAERENYTETFNSRTADLLLGKQDEKQKKHHKLYKTGSFLVLKFIAETLVAFLISSSPKCFYS